MSIINQLIERGLNDLAALYEKHEILSIQMAMDQMEENPDLKYSPAYLLVKQIKAVSKTTDLTDALYWADVQAVFEEYLFLEKDSQFPFMIEEEQVVQYKEAVEGNVEAMLALATNYRLQEYDDLAYNWYQTCAKLEVAEAYYWIGNFIYMGELVEQDLQAVYEAYKKAAYLEFPDAMNNFGDMYLRGEVVDQDDAKAFYWFEKAANAGVPESMYTLGYLYKNGRGIAQDETLSNEWFEKSAIAGDVFAINKMGHAAFAENDGETALSWYLKAAEKNDPYGEYNVGFCYESGIGTEVDVKRAKYWYQKAILHGDTEAKIRLNALMKG